MLVCMEVVLWVTTESGWWSVLYAEAVKCISSAESARMACWSVRTFVAAEHGTYGCLAWGRLLNEQC